MEKATKFASYKGQSQTKHFQQNVEIINNKRQVSLAAKLTLEFMLVVQLHT